MTRSDHLFSSLLCVAVLGLSAVQGAPAAASEKVGVVAAVRGTVDLVPPAEPGRRAKSGGAVHFLETVKSAEASGLQVLLLDETTFTVGPQSEIIIDEMVYDPEGELSKLLVNVTRGSFRYISGDIAKQNPENVTIKTPTGTIGIRGTNLFAVENGGQWFFGLLGPGPNNNTGDKPGGFVFENDQGRAEVLRPGFGFTVAPGIAPSDVAPIPRDVMVRFSTAMAERGEDANGGEGEQNGEGEGNGDGAQKPAAKPSGEGEKQESFAAATDQSGQATATTKVNAAVQETTELVTKIVTTETSTASQTTALLTAAVANTYELIPLGYSDLYTFSGTATYNVTGVKMYTGAFPCPATGCTTNGITAEELKLAFNQIKTWEAENKASVGTYNFNMTADFSQRSVSGSYTSINISNTTPAITLNNQTMNYTINYTNKSGAFNESVKLDNTPAGYTLEGGFVFLKSTATPPHLAQALMVRSGTQDQVVGGSIVAPQ